MKNHHSIKQIINSFLSQTEATLSLGKIGLEKEGIRVRDSCISKSGHPQSIGSALCNKYITTDFSEAQLEFITNPSSAKMDGIRFLDNINHFVSCNINNEIIWPFSMPPPIESENDIPIASYGTSNLGLFKKTYRTGLSNRYGRSMQALSGIHYNYSLPDELTKGFFESKTSSNNLEIRSEIYFSMLRNIIRMNWITLYFFGATPVITKDYIKGDIDLFKQIDEQTFYLPYATSLRMSDYGYKNLLRTTSNISLNSLNKFILDLKKTSDTISKDFQKIDKVKQAQLNPNIFQIDDEYYSVARPKSSTIANRRLTWKLKQGGVDYIELRSLDLNPYSRNGIDIETIYFLEVFILYCLFEKSEPIDKDEYKRIWENDLLVAKYGRDPKLLLGNGKSKIGLREWAYQILDAMAPIAEMMDGNGTNYKSVVEKFRSIVNKPHKTLSGQFIDQILNDECNFIDLGNSIGESNLEHYLKTDKSENIHWSLLEKEARDSFIRQKELESEVEKSFAIYIKEYLED